jgi:GT2 family glycosyltransferase
MTERLCDVIIPTRNRREPLQRCLRSLTNQSARDFGIIIVDDHSDEPLDDAVAEVTKTAGFDIEPTIVRLPTTSGPAAARNAGVAASNAEYILFLDDDVVVDRHLIEVHLSEVRSEDPSGLPVITRGPFLEPVEWDPTPWNLWEARMATRGTNAIIRGDYVPTWRQFHTGNNCMPTELFHRAGGFDETFKRLEDDEFGWRVHEQGCVVRFVPAALAWHYSNRSLESWLAIPRGYAYYTVVMDRRYPESRYVEMRESELAMSSPVLRVARRIAAGPRRTKMAVGLAVALGRATHRLRLDPLTVGAFSLAYDLTFCASFRESQASLPA